MNDSISYSAGYKYQLASTYTVTTPLRPTATIKTDWLTLTSTGRLYINRAYAWDGPSGPTLDTRNFMRGSLIHDALYQLMRLRLLDPTTDRQTADKFLRTCCKEDGMSAVRATWVYYSVRLGGGSSTDPENERPVLSAP